MKSEFIVLKKAATEVECFKIYEWKDHVYNPVIYCYELDHVYSISIYYDSKLLLLEWKEIYNDKNRHFLLKYNIVRQLIKNEVIT